MASTRISNAAAIAACNAVVDRLDDGPAAGLLRIYTGAPPVNVEDAATGTLLAELTLSDPAFGNAADSGGSAQAAANSIASDLSADATGVAGWWRAVDSNGNGVIQGDVTAAGGGGDLQLDNTSIAAGQEVSISSWTVTQPEAAV